MIRKLTVKNQKKRKKTIPNKNQNSGGINQLHNKGKAYALSFFCNF